MTETEETPELTEPSVADVPEPDQEPSEPAEPTLEETAEEEADEAEGAPAEPTEAVVDEKAIEKAYKQLVKHSVANSNAISRIMGEDAQMLEPCPRCMGGDPDRPKTPGFIWPAALVPLLPEHKAEVKLSIGEGVEPEWKDAEDASRCPKCDGRGKVKTGSQVVGQERLPCLECSGRGWIGARVHKGETVPANDVPQFVPVGVGAVEPQPPTDPWGRLRDDPLYGVMPGFERD